MAGKKRSKGKGKKAEEPVVEEKDLERFAGSSEEEEEDNNQNDNADSDSDIDSSKYEKDEPQKPSIKKKETKSNNKKHKKNKDNNNENDDMSEDGVAADKEAHSSEEEADEDSDFEQAHPSSKQQGPAGMAGAMLKILGGAADQANKKKTNTNTASAVLSKTTTPLQKALQQEREQAKALREKRKLKAVNPLPAFHIPLSVATTMPTASVSRELELERLHRRVATRGVVALFNAVAQHQKKGNSVTEEPATKKKKTQEVQKMTKHGFLDMIKTAAVSKSTGSSSVGNKDGDDHNNNDMAGATGNSSKQKAGQETKWKAMQDDFMLNPKKNWDQEDDESSDDDSDKPDMDQSDDEAAPAQETTGKKRQLVQAR